MVILVFDEVEVDVLLPLLLFLSSVLLSSVALLLSYGFFVGGAVDIEGVYEVVDITFY